jgi:protein TonB
VVHAAVVEPVSPVAPAPVSEAAVLAAAVAPAPEAQSRSAAAAEAFADAMSAAVTAPVATVEADPQPVKPVENNVAAAAAAPVRKLRAEVVAAAAVLVVAVVGVPTGALWLQRQVAARNAAALMQEQPAPAPVARALPAPKPQAQPDPAPAAVVPEPTPLPPAPVAAAPRPAAAPVRAARTVKTPSKVDKLPAPTSQPAAPAAASTPLPAAPAAVVAAPVPAVQPQVVAVPETPAGKLFEPNEVDVTPRIASRVDPQLPGNLTGRPGNDVVVVRILVSQSGHPFRVNLLRRSRLGPSVDEAVLSAVKQWTFTPARKRGEVVSCWFNVGVSLTAN